MTSKRARNAEVHVDVASLLILELVNDTLDSGHSDAVVALKDALHVGNLGYVVAVLEPTHDFSYGALSIYVGKHIRQDGSVYPIAYHDLIGATYSDSLTSVAVEADGVLAAIDTCLVDDGGTLPLGTMFLVINRKTTADLRVVECVPRTSLAMVGVEALLGLSVETLELDMRVSPDLDGNEYKT